MPNLVLDRLDTKLPESFKVVLHADLDGQSIGLRLSAISQLRFMPECGGVLEMLFTISDLRKPPRFEPRLRHHYHAETSEVLVKCVSPRNVVHDVCRNITCNVPTGSLDASTSIDSDF
jgi:hypothetical protein